MTEFYGLQEAARKFHEFAEDAEQAAEQFNDAVDKGVATTAVQVQRTAQEKVPVDSGELRISIGTHKLDTAIHLVGTNKHYAPYVEFGRGPVEAKQADALRFWIDGDITFRQSVGPAEPQPFLRPALLRHERDLTPNIEDEIERLFEEVYG